MNKIKILVCDPPWSFSDKLTMSKTKRGAEANYKLLTIKDLKELPIKKIVNDNSILALWVPSSLLDEGIEVMKAWGYNLKQTHVWVKTKNEPLKVLLKEILSLFVKKTLSFKDGFNLNSIQTIFTDFNLNNILSFKMGRLFRQTHEIVLIGTRGNIYNHLKNKSQRSVHLFPATKHSEKPENLQDMLDLMFPDFKKEEKLELFARRNRSGWICKGNECEGSFGEDIRESINKLM